jgi:hypothetical protein
LIYCLGDELDTNLQLGILSEPQLLSDQ